MTLEQTIDDIIMLSQIPSVTGFEDQLISYLKEGIEYMGYETEITPRRMLWVKPKNGEASNHYTTAHVDRIGLISQDGRIIYSNQYGRKDLLGLDYNPGLKLIGEIRERFQGEELVTLDGERTVLGSDVKDDDTIYSPIEFYLDQKVETDGPLSLAKPVSRTTNMYGREELEGMLDNIASVGTLYSLLRDGMIKGNVLFTIDEEIGVSGDHIVDFLKGQGIEETSELLILDTTPYDKEHYRRDEVNLRQRDGRGWFDPLTTARVAQACKYSETPFRFKDVHLQDTSQVTRRDDGTLKGLGFTELGKVSMLTDGKINGATLQLPNTGDGINERVSYEGLDAFRRTIMAYHNLL